MFAAAAESTNDAASKMTTTQMTTQVDAADLLNLLESTDVKVVLEIEALIKTSLSNSMYPTRH